MKEFREINDHVFEGEPLSPGISPREARHAEAIRAALRSVKTPECRLQVEHLRNAVLDTSSRRPARPVKWGWLGSGLGIAVAAGMLAVLQPKTDVEAPVLGKAGQPGIVALQSEPAVGQAVPEIKAEVSEPPAAAKATTVAPEPMRRPKPRIRVRPKSDAKPPLNDTTLLARQEPQAKREAPAQKPETPAEATVAPAAGSTASEQVVVVVQPGTDHGKAIEVGLGQDVLFGG